MKYLPAPKKIVVQYLPPKQDSKIILLPDQDQDYRRGIAIAVGDECPPWYLDNTVIYGKWGGLLLDKDLGIYLIDVSEIFCIESDQE